MQVKPPPPDSLKHLLDNILYPTIQTPGEMHPLACRTAEAKIKRRYGDGYVEAPKNFDPKTTYSEIVALQAAGALDQLSPRSRRQAPWVLFYDMPHKPTLGQAPDIVNGLFDLFAKSGRPSLVVSTLHCFLRDYPRDWSTFDLLRTGLERLLGARDDRRIHTLDRVRRNFLLEEDGPARLAKVLLIGEGDIAAGMAEAKLINELEAGKFTQACFAEMCRQVRKNLSAGSLTFADLKRFLVYATKGGDLRFPAMSADLANCLLEPLDVASPPAGLKDTVQGFLLKHLRDPRLARERWLGVSDQAKGVILRWLVGATLEDFFHVLDRTAPGTEGGRRWTYRRAFWGAYNKKRLISDAWIALGPSAKDLIRRGGGSDVLKYGALEGAGASDCLLLLRIGNLTIAEWSHMGSCRIWHAASKTKPEMYRYRYTKSSIVYSSPDETVRHAGAENGVWQLKLASYIRTHTGADVRESDYKLRGW